MSRNTQTQNENTQVSEGRKLALINIPNGAVPARSKAGGVAWCRVERGRGWVEFCKSLFVNFLCLDFCYDFCAMIFLLWFFHYDISAMIFPLWVFRYDFSGMNDFSAMISAMIFALWFPLWFFAMIFALWFDAEWKEEEGQWNSTIFLLTFSCYDFDKKTSTSEEVNKKNPVQI